MTRFDADERADMIEAAKSNFRSGEWLETRTRATLAACGLNATEIQEIIDELKRNK